MIRHIVMFRLKPTIELHERENILKLVKNNFEKLVDKIPGIKFYEVGINISTSPVAYDYVINSEFESVADLEIYSTHQAHVEAVKFNRQYSDTRIVVDYKI